ncbi:phenylalanine--tRNA ligase subunit beta [Candidatus Dependentiae bacterium]|nr:phenylalanine--tRNA ligase subunit beta [Candidatus Dependentiae bacterium]
MLVALSWVKEYIDIPETAVQLAEILTNGGIEVSSVKQPGLKLKHILAGKVESIINFDKLNKCRINCGSYGFFECVTNDKSVISGDIVPYAVPGSVLADGTTVTKRTIKNIESEGMMLSTVELGITETANSIWKINDSNLLPGEDLIKKLNLDDWIIEYEITPNRSDCLNVIGLSYQIAAITGRNVKLKKSNYTTDSSININDKIKISISDYSACPKYTGNYIENISVKPADALIQTRLYQSGLRAINNIVDITNYVMLEYGQPLHAFDYDLIQGKEIVVRHASENEIIKTIDGQDRICSTEILVIADKNRPVAVAGVMGGFDSEVTDKTSKTLIESAYFNPVSVRKSSRILGLSSESSYRFERGIDYSNVKNASDRAVELIQKSCPESRVSSNLSEIFKTDLVQRKITIKFSNIKRIIGIDIDKNKILKILENMNCEIAGQTEKELNIIIPMRRTDIEREIDVIEEISVLYGYGNIPDLPPNSDLSCGGLTDKQKFSIDLLKLFVDKGFYECVNYSFTDPDLNSDFTEDYDENSTVKISNPLGKEISVMRSSIIPSLIKIMQNNTKYRNSNLNFFETGKKYKYSGKTKAFEETNAAAFAMTEKTVLSNWDDKPGRIDFFYVKGILNDVFETLNIEKCEYKINNSIRFLQPGQSADIFINEIKTGFLGKIHPDAANKYDLPDNLYLCEVNADILFDNYSKTPVYKEFSIFPYTVRDMSLLMPKKIEYKKVISKIKSLNIEILQNVEFGGIYESEVIDKQFTAALLKFTYRAKDRTLKDDEIETAHKQIYNTISSEFGITAR